MLIKLNKIFKIDTDFENVFIIDNKTKNYNKKIPINTSTRVLNGKKYDTLYIIEPKTSYLIPLPSNYQNNSSCIVNNLIGETGIILQQVKNDYILLYNTNENLIFLNKDINICNIEEA